MRSIREELFLHPTFEPYSTGGFSVGTLLRPLRPATSDEIRDAIKALVADGLAEQSGTTDTGEPTFRATEKGWVAREDWLTAQRLRHRVFDGQYDGPGEHVVLALLAAEEIQSEHTPAGYLAGDGSIVEPLLTFYAVRCGVRDLSAIIARLTSKGLVRSKEEQQLIITPSGRREYDDVVVPALRIAERSTVLDLLRIGSVALFATPLPSTLVENLQSRWREATLCESVEAYLAATLMYASVAEGVLGWLIREHHDEAAAAASAPKRNGKAIPVDAWNLVDMVRVAREVGWFDVTLGGFVDQLRDVRNLVHPWKQVQTGTVVDRQVCALAKMVAERATAEVARLAPMK